MSPTPCQISLTFDWEREEEGYPRAWAPSKSEGERRSIADLYGELEIFLTHGAERIPLGLWDVADDLIWMFTKLAEDLVGCGQTYPESDDPPYRDFVWRREGKQVLIRKPSGFDPATRKWIHRPDLDREFAVDGVELVAAYFETICRFLSELSSAIAPEYRSLLAPFEQSMAGLEREAWKVWPRT